MKVPVAGLILSPPKIYSPHSVNILFLVLTSLRSSLFFLCESSNDFYTNSMALSNVRSVSNETSSDPFQPLRNPCHLTMGLDVEGWGERQVISFGVVYGKKVYKHKHEILLKSHCLQSQLQKITSESEEESRHRRSMCSCPEFEMNPVHALQVANFASVNTCRANPAPAHVPQLTITFCRFPSFFTLPEKLAVCHDRSWWDFENRDTESPCSSWSPKAKLYHTLGFPFFLSSLRIASACTLNVYRYVVPSTLLHSLSHLCVCFVNETCKFRDCNCTKPNPHISAMIPSPCKPEVCSDKCRLHLGFMYGWHLHADSFAALTVPFQSPSSLLSWASETSKYRR